MKESEKPSGSIVAANRTELNQSQKLVVTSDGFSAPMVPVELVLTSGVQDQALGWPSGWPSDMPSTKTLDHIVHLTPPRSVHHVSQQFRDLGFKCVCRAYVGISLT